MKNVQYGQAATRAFVLSVAAIGMLVAAGCGNHDDPAPPVASSTPPPLSPVAAKKAEHGKPMLAPVGGLSINPNWNGGGIGTKVK